MLYFIGTINHWVCVLSVSDEEEISLLDSSSLKITCSLLLQIASMFKPLDMTTCQLQIKQLPVQQQIGTLDCGLFAIAFAVELCKGTDPTKMVFLQDKMRDHLLQCFEMRKFETFPKKMLRSKKLHMQQQESQLVACNLYCFCRYPETYDKQMGGFIFQ